MKYINNIYVNETSIQNDATDLNLFFVDRAIMKIYCYYFISF